MLSHAKSLEIDTNVLDGAPGIPAGLRLSPEEEPMATPGQLVAAIAQSTGILEATVTSVDRQLVISGFRSKGGRGRGSAHVNARDAANLLTAVLCSREVKSCVEVVEAFAHTVPHADPKQLKDYKESNLEYLAKLNAKHSFIDALEALILQGQTKLSGKRVDMPKAVQIVGFSTSTLGLVRVAGLEVCKTFDIWYAPSASMRPKLDSGDAATSTQITQVTVLEIARLLAEGHA